MAFMPSSFFGLTIASAALVASGAAGAQTLPIASPSALAAHLRAKGLPSIMGFRQAGAVRCRRGGAGESFAYECQAMISDTSRGGDRATIDIAIFNGRVDVGLRIRSMKSYIDTQPGRWKIHTPQDVGFSVAGRRVAQQASCHQAVGVRNSAAMCLLPIAANVIVIAQTRPRSASTSRFTTSPNGGSDSFDDVAHAAQLAVVGAIPVAELLLGTTTPVPVRKGCEGPNAIFRQGC